jgi:hypothetical protein
MNDLPLVIPYDLRLPIRTYPSRSVEKLSPQELSGVHPLAAPYAVACWASGNLDWLIHRHILCEGTELLTHLLHRTRRSMGPRIAVNLQRPKKCHGYARLNADLSPVASLQVDQRG